MKWWQDLSHEKKLFYNDNKDYKKLTVRQIQIIYHKYTNDGKEIDHRYKNRPFF